MTYVFSVFLFRHQADTGCLTAFNLMLKTRPGAVSIETVLALTHIEYLLQEIQSLTNRRGTGIGAKKPARKLL